MIFMIIYLFCIVAALGLGVLAGVSDFKGMTIPNYISVCIVAAFIGAYGAAWGVGAEIFRPVLSHVLAGLSVFAVTFVMFNMKAIGGGDSKLATAFAFWVGLKLLPVYLFYMAVAGGVIGGVAIFLKKKKPVAAPVEGSWIARVQAGEGIVPYGIPIVFGALMAFLMAGLLLPENLRLFLISN